MPAQVYIALREMRRSIGRFTLLTGAVALLVLLLLFFQSVAGALTLGLTGGIENNSADVIVYADTARSNPAASFLSAERVEAVAAVEGVAAVAIVGRGAFEVQGPDGEISDGIVIGLDPPGAGGVARVGDGRRATDRGEAVFSGSPLTDRFDLGETVTVEGIEFTIVGTAADAAFDVSPTLYVSFSDYRRITEIRAGTPVPAPISWFGVTVEPGFDPATVSAGIAERVDDVDALTRSAAADSLPGVGQITQSFTILYLLLFIVVTIVTGVFFLILTVQKQSSLVLLRAIGASRRDVVAPVLIQVVAVVGLGSLLGAVVAAGLLRVARDTFGSSLELSTTITTIVFIVALGVLASLGAVRRVLRIDPVQVTTSGTVG